MKFFHKLTIILALAGIGGLTACSDDDSGSSNATCAR